MVKIKKDGLFFGGFSQEQLFKTIEIPSFLVFLDRITQNCQNFKNAANEFFPQHEFYYSAKTNLIPEILERISMEGYGVQVVSKNEWNLARAAGFLDERIIIDGIYHAKETWDMIQNEKTTIVESWLSNINYLRQKVAVSEKHLSLGLRFAYPSGEKRLGFRSDEEETMERLAGLIKSSENLNLEMIASHAGSQLMHEAVYQANCKNLLGVHDFFEKNGLVGKNMRINLGGGFPEPEIANQEKLRNIFSGIRDIIQENHEPRNFKICFEPGRYLVADAAVLISRINQLFQDSGGQKWALLDVGMDVISRFANSHYRFFSMEHAGEPHGTPLSFQGRVPTEQDVLGRGIHFAKDVKGKEHVLIMNTGAYTNTFSRKFSFDPPGIAIINNGEIAFSRPRETS